MPNWKKVIISGSDAALASLILSDVSFGEGTENLLALNPISNNIIQIPIDDLPIAVTEYTNGSNNRVITSTGVESIHAESFFTYNDVNGALQLFRVSDNSTGLTISPNISSNYISITPFGSTNTIRLDGNLRLSEGKRISFDDDPTNTFIRADFEDPETLEFYADRNIRAFPDDRFEVIKIDNGYRYLFNVGSGPTSDIPRVGIGVENPDKELVVRGEISASNSIYAGLDYVPSEDIAQNHHIPLYYTESGIFKYGNINDVVSVPNLQQVTDEGSNTSNPIISKDNLIAHESNGGSAWGGGTSLTPTSGFILSEGKSRTHVTPQATISDSFTFVGNRIGASGQGANATLAEYPDNELLYTPYIRLNAINTGYQFTVIGSISTFGGGGGGGGIVEGGGSGIEFTGNPGIYFYNTDASSSASGSRIIESASALIKFNTTSSAIQFFAGSTNEELKEVLFISKSGDNPRIGIGVSNPINTLDFVERTDSPEGTELLLRGSRVLKGAEVGDEAGKLTFSIDSGSFQDLKTSGSVATIKTEITTVENFGVTGDLIISTTNSPKLPPSEVLRISNAVGGSSLTGSFNISQDLKVENNASIRGTLALQGMPNVSASIAEKRDYPFNIGIFGGTYQWNSTDSNERVLHGFTDGPTAGGTENSNDFGTTSIGTLNVTQEVVSPFTIQYSGLYSPAKGIPHIKAWGKSSDANFALASASIGVSVWSLDTEPANGSSADQTLTLRAQIPPTRVEGEGGIYYLGNGMEASGSVALDQGTFYFVSFDLSGSLASASSLKMNFNLWLE